MTRLTRAESQARTRAQLLTTARELFLRDGYLATSLDKVADAAGFSKGAVYSNFRNKDQLCLAVLDEIRAARAAEIAGLLTAPTIEDRLRRFEQWAERVIGDPQWTALEFEFAVQARRDPALRQELANRLAAVGGVVQSAVAGLTSTAAGAEAAGQERTDGHSAGGHATSADGTDEDSNDAANEHALSPAGAGLRGGMAGESAIAPDDEAAAAARRATADSDAASEIASNQGAADVRGAIGGELPMAVDEAAVALLCLGVGLGLFRSIDPAMPVSALVNTVRVLAGVPARG